MTKTRVGTAVVGIAIALVLVVYLRQRSEKAKFPIVYSKLAESPHPLGVG
jgi:hypothetical protein